MTTSGPPLKLPLVGEGKLRLRSREIDAPVWWQRNCEQRDWKHLPATVDRMVVDVVCVVPTAADDDVDVSNVVLITVVVGVASVDVVVRSILQASYVGLNQAKSSSVCQL